MQELLRECEKAYGENNLFPNTGDNAYNIGDNSQKQIN